MFKKMKFGSSGQAASTEKTIIGQSAVVLGNIVSQDLVQLKSHVVGNIDVNGSPNAQLSVLSQAHVRVISMPSKRLSMAWSLAILNPQGVSSCIQGRRSKAIFHTRRWPLSMVPSFTE